MQFPDSWLFSIIKHDINSKDLSDKLTMSGLEVESLFPFIRPFKNKIFFIKVIKVVKYDFLNKINICFIDDGSKKIGKWACCYDKEISSGSLALVTNNGNLSNFFNKKIINDLGSDLYCGEVVLVQDLELPDYLKDYILNNANLGDDIYRSFNLGDNIFNIKLTPNRADCLSIVGIAREVSALTGASVSIPEYKIVLPNIKDSLKPAIVADDLCGRYSGRIIRNLNSNIETPVWIKDRLIKSGQNPVSVLVDISNYIMLEFGIPSHIYDLDSTSGDILVRWSRKGERVKVLGERIIDLDDNVGVISDSKGIIGLAGIIGSLNSSVTSYTSNIYIESAFWNPSAISGISRKYKINSEAAYRYERGVDYNLTVECLEKITRLIVDICGGDVGPIEDNILNLPKKFQVAMRLSKCCRVLGVELDKEDVFDIFSKLKMSFQERDDVFYVTPPSYRFDIKIEEDLIEEVARLYGYDNIPSNPPFSQTKMLSFSETVLSRYDIVDMMVSRDYQEVINYSFVPSEWENKYCGNNDAIKLDNPISSYMSVMRSSLIPGLIKNVCHNFNRQFSRIRLFEIGRVFYKDTSVIEDKMNVPGINQPVLLSAIAYGSSFEDQWSEKSRLVDFYDIKCDLESLFGLRSSCLTFDLKPHPSFHPSRSASIIINGNHVGWIGELSPILTMETGLINAPVIFEISLDCLLKTKLPEVKVLSKQPMVIRDLSFLVNKNIRFQDIRKSIEDLILLEEELLIIKSFKLFDVWFSNTINNQEKSIALRFWFQDDVTLEEDRVVHCVNLIMKHLIKTFDARHRI